MKNLLTAILLALSFHLSAQQFSNDFVCDGSRSYEVIDGKKTYHVVGDFAYSIKTKGRDVSIQKFDIKEMKEVKRKVYEDFLPKSMNVYGAAGNEFVIKMQGGRIFYLYSEYKKSDGVVKLKARELNKENCTFSGTPLTLITPSRPATSRPYTFNYGSFFIRTSLDTSNLLVSYRLDPLKRNDSQNFDQLGYHVFDTDLNEIWADEKTMPYTEKDMNNLNVNIMNNGTVYMLAFITVNRSLEILRIAPEGVSTQQVPIIRDMRAPTFKMREDHDGNLICCGFYMDNVNARRAEKEGFMANGLYYFEVTPSGEVINLHDSEFPLELIQQYSTDKEKADAAKRAEKSVGGFSKLIMVSCTIDPNGGAVVVGERNYICKGDDLCSSNVIVMRLDQTGKVKWLKHLPKEQRSTRNSWEGLGVKYIRGGDAHYLLFLDNIKNLELPLDQNPSLHVDGAGGYLTAFKIDEESGDVERHTLLNVREFKGKELFQFSTSRIFKANDNVFLTEVYIKGKKDIMVKMELTSR